MKTKQRVSHHFDKQNSLRKLAGIEPITEMEFAEREKVYGGA
jgi:hypothetical protein